MIIFLSYLFYFAAASASPLQRRWLAVRHEGGNQIDFAFRVTFIVLVLSLLLPFFSPFYLVGDRAIIVLLTALCGIFGAGFFISSFVAQRHVDAGVSVLVSNIYTPITIVLATLFLKEQLTILQAIGTVLLLSAIFLISKKHRIGVLKFDRYFLLMLASGVMLGIVLVAERSLQRTTGFTAGTMLSWWAQCGALGIAAIFARSRTSYNTRDTLTTGVLRFFQSLSWVILTFVVGNLSIVSAVTTFKVVVIFIAAAIFLK